MHRGTLAAVAALVVSIVPTAQALDAGAAKVELTPPVGTPLNGYGDRLGRPSVGVHDPLWARCLYLDDGDTQVYLVNTDLCVIHRELRARVLELAPANASPEGVILTATHTHSAQGAMSSGLPMRFVAGAYSPEILDFTAGAIAQSMQDAYANRERASIGYGTGEQEVLSVNRAVRGGPIDTQIGVIRVDDADGNPIAIVGNFAAHPTSVPQSHHYYISADYVGFYYDELESLANGDTVALFMNGAEGNQTIADPEGNSGWARTENVGRLLARRVKGIANDILCTELALRVAASDVPLPPTIAESFQPETAFLQTLEIGDLSIAFLPGEPLVEIGFALREAALARGYEAHFTVGLSNNFLMYFVPPSYYYIDRYETEMNFFGPDVLNWLVGSFERLMERPGPEPDASEPEPGFAAFDTGGAVELLRAGGDPYAAGRDAGRIARIALARAFERYVREPASRGATMPSNPALATLAQGFDIARIAVPFLAMETRFRHVGLSDNSFAYLRGMADGAQVPYDVLWLTQVAPEEFGLDAEARAPLGSYIGVQTDAGLLVGWTLEAPLAESIVLTESSLAGERSFLGLRAPWQFGAYGGINDAGVIVLAHNSGLQSDAENGRFVPRTALIRDVLATATTLDAAIAALQSPPWPREAGFFVAGPGEDGFDAARVSVASDVDNAVYMGDTGLTASGSALGATPPDRPALAPALADLVDAERRDIDMLRAALVAGAATNDPDSLWKPGTRCAVVLDPQTRTLCVVPRQPNGTLGDWVCRSLEPGAADG